jgi:hypothetical protein
MHASLCQARKSCPAVASTIQVFSTITSELKNLAMGDVKSRK